MEEIYIEEENYCDYEELDEIETIICHDTKQNIRWSSKQKLQLIKLAKDREELWDTSTTFSKDEIWLKYVEIGDLMGLSALNIRQQWDYLKRKYANGGFDHAKYLNFKNALNFLDQVADKSNMEIFTETFSNDEDESSYQFAIDKVSMGFTQMCRLCLTKCKENDENVENFSCEYTEMTGFIVDVDDPEKICQSCLENLINFKKFKDECTKTEEILIKIKESAKQGELPIQADDLIDETEDEFRLFVKPKKAPKEKVQKIKNLNGSHKKKKYTPIKGPFFCDICGVTLKNKCNLFKHMKFQHLGAKYYCHKCPKVFKQDSSLHIHLKQVHPSKEDFVHECKVCHRIFGFYRSLKRHEESHKTTKKLCNICGREFKATSRMHSIRCQAKYGESKETKKFPCEICGQKFMFKDYLTSHMRTHQPKQYFCPKCPEEFTVPLTLKNHIARSHPEFKLPPMGTCLRGVDLNKIEYDAYGHAVSVPKR